MIEWFSGLSLADKLGVASFPISCLSLGIAYASHRLRVKQARRKTPTFEVLSETEGEFSGWHTIRVTARNHDNVRTVIDSVSGPRNVRFVPQGDTMPSSPTKDDAKYKGDIPNDAGISTLPIDRAIDPKESLYLCFHAIHWKPGMRLRFKHRWADGKRH